MLQRIPAEKGASESMVVAPKGDLPPAGAHLGGA
jgi:hypothetical protein